MTELIIGVNDSGITAIEIYCGDDVKYVQTFDNWADLIGELGRYFPEYAYVNVREYVKGV